MLLTFGVLVGVCTWYVGSGINNAGQKRSQQRVEPSRNSQPVSMGQYPVEMGWLSNDLDFIRVYRALWQVK